jgi:hypothetical protein
MTTSANDQYVTSVTLSRGGADALRSLVGRMTSESTTGPSDFAALRERLDDALWLSRWLREEVSLELRSEEKIALMEAVLTSLSANVSGEETRGLEELSRQLSCPGDAWGVAKASSEGRRTLPTAVCGG